MARRTPRFQPQEPVTEPVAPEVVQEPVEAQAATVEVSEAETDEPYVSPLILAARRGEQVDFGGTIDAETPDTTQE